MSGPRRIRSGELIDTAKYLVGPRQRGRPRTARLRRAVSAAYYALFHALTWYAAGELLGVDADTPERRRVVRWFSHQGLRGLAEAVSGARGSDGRAKAAVAIIGPPSQDLADVATAFITLQDARNSADYDHNFEVNPETARTRIAQAEDALATVDRLWSTNDGQLRLFLRLAGGVVSIARNQ